MKKHKEQPDNTDKKKTNDTNKVTHKPAEKKAGAIGEKEYEEDDSMNIRMKPQVLNKKL